MGKTNVAIKNVVVNTVVGSDNTYYISWTALTDNQKNKIDYIKFFVSGEVVTTTGTSSYQPIVNTVKLKASRAYSDNFTVDSSIPRIHIIITPVAKSAYKKGSDKAVITKYNDYHNLENDPYAPSRPSAPSFTLVTGSDNIAKAEYTSTELPISPTTSQQAAFVLTRDDEEIAADIEYDWQTVPSSGTRKVSKQFTLNSGYEYSCAVILRNVGAAGSSGKLYHESKLSEYSTIASSEITYPAQVTGLTVSTISSSQISLSWNQESTAASQNGYVIQWTNDERLFDSGSGVNSQTSTVYQNVLITVETGNTWYFRVAAVNANNKQGPWSETKSAAAALKPNAPTTWSLQSAVMLGGTVRLYCTHNSADGSKPTQAKFAYHKTGQTTDTVVTRDYGLGPDDYDYTMSYDLPLPSGSYSDGNVLYWKAATQGIAAVGYGDYSVTREIAIYQQPTLSVSQSTQSWTITGFPASFTITAAPTSQTPVSCAVSLVALYDYNVDDEYGEALDMPAGTEVYSRVFPGSVFDSSNQLTISLTPSEARLVNGGIYRMNVSVAMNSGLSASFYHQVDVVLSGANEYAIDYDIVTSTKDSSVAIAPSAYVIDNTDELTTLVSNVYGSVYRINHDNSFTLIAKDLVNSETLYVYDPHPNLRDAAYRIVFMNATNGAVQYKDLIVDDIFDKSIIIQWDEEPTGAYYSNDLTTEVLESFSSGMRLTLKGNNKVQDSNEPDVGLVSYIGRTNPVAYYGTQKGYSQSLSADVPKTDTETLKLLRQLQNYSGDVYVREPSGTGYWANVSVSFDISYDNSSPVIPVTIDAKRVDGGE